MADKPILMENTKINSFSIFNEGVYQRNSRIFRKVYKQDLTAKMCTSAGLSVPDYLKETSKAVGIVEVDAPVVEVDAPVVESQRPDIEDWDEDKLRDYCMENDIPTHPAAKKPGLVAAITRYFDELVAD